MSTDGGIADQYLHEQSVSVLLTDSAVLPKGGGSGSGSMVD